MSISDNQITNKLDNASNQVNLLTKPSFVTITKIVVLIVHYNDEQLTKQCLNSLAKLKLKQINLAVIVIDNGSIQPLRLDEESYPWECRVLRSDSNLGFTVGNNIAINEAKRLYQPDYVLLLNNDTIVDRNLVANLLQSAKLNPQAGLISPLINFAEGHEFHQHKYHRDQRGQVIWYAGGTVDWRNIDAFHRLVDEVDQSQAAHINSIDFATGCCMLIPTKVLDRVGLFDQRFFLYFEDLDLSFRIRLAGYDLIFCPKAKLWHINAGSSGGAGSPVHVYYQTRNRLHIFMKYANLRPYFGSKSGIFARIIRNLWIHKYQVFIYSLAIKFLILGSRYQQIAARDWLLGRMGKQSLWT